MVANEDGFHVSLLCRPDEKIDDVLVAMEDQRGHAASAYDNQAVPPTQGKFLRRQILHRRREIEHAVEPRLDGVLVGRDDIQHVAGHQGTDVAGDDFLRKLLLGARDARG